MGILDWLGPTSLTKRRGWDALPLPAAEAKSLPLAMPTTALTVQTLSFMPGIAPVAPVDAPSNSAVVACLRALSSAIAEPELAVYALRDGRRIAVPDTELGRLLARPNPSLSMDTLLGYAVACLHVDGNAYWRKLRAGDAERGPVVELWPIAPSAIQVRTEHGSDDFITAYRYSYGAGQHLDLAPADVVHFRLGLDPLDHRLGVSPLRSLVREVSADQQATRYAERLLSNLAINGLTLSFDKDAPPIDQATADELKARISAAYGGDNAGATAVLSPGAELSALGFSPEQMDLGTLHRVPEERICAVLAVPAAMIGLGVGLEHSIYNNVRQAEEHFTERTLLPLWAALAATITMSLVPDFGSVDTMVVDFDAAGVRALADDQNALAERLKILVETGIIGVDEARAELGLPPIAAPSEAAGRRVTEIRSVPVRERKAAEDLPRRYDDLRDDELPTWEREIIAFLDQQLRRATRRLRAGADVAEELVTEGEAVLLGETLTPLQLRVLGRVERLVVAELGVAFHLDDPSSRRFLRDAGVNIAGITDTTRRAVRDALIEGQRAGEGIDQLARRLRALPAFDAPRGRVVARTELGLSTTEASLTSYRASGVVVGVRVHDGDDDAACAAINGRAFPLDQAPPALEHPNCTRALAPLTDAAELTRSA